MLREKRPARWFVIAIILFMAICAIAAIWNQVAYGCHNDNPPLASFYVAADLNQQDQVIQVFAQFAQENGFRFEKTYYTPDYEELSLDLTRKDIEIFADKGPYGPEEYVVTFYNNDCIHPTKVSDIIGLVNNLKTAVGTVPGAVLSLETPTAAPTFSYPR